MDSRKTMLVTKMSKPFYSLFFSLIDGGSSAPGTAAHFGRRLLFMGVHSAKVITWRADAASRQEATAGFVPGFLLAPGAYEERLTDTAGVMLARTHHARHVVLLVIGVVGARGGGGVRDPGGAIGGGVGLLAKDDVAFGTKLTPLPGSTEKRVEIWPS